MDKIFPVTYDSGRESVGIQRVGESLRSLYGYQYRGVNKANGNPGFITRQMAL